MGKRTCSNETKQKIGAANKGRKRSDETRLRMSEAQKARHARERATNKSEAPTETVEMGTDLQEQLIKS